ncbi:unnamed protein product [Phytomonas sp. Hart1]|nr:unnamed protein product [Phytomonas sp. Hart1]|eukprot:CCW66052.1 unnamed protein product [Phytomonas sp. isolate Hart1]
MKSRTSSSIDTKIPTLSADPKLEWVSASASKSSCSLSSEDSRSGAASAPALAQLDIIHQPPLDEIEYYDTPTHCYLIGTDCDYASYHILSFTKKPPVVDASSISSINSSVGCGHTTRRDNHRVELPTMVSSKTPQKNMDTSTKTVDLEMSMSTLTHDEMISFVSPLRGSPGVWYARIRALLGAIYLTKGHYLIIAKSRKLVARIGPHRIFKATEINLISLMLDPERFKLHGNSQHPKTAAADAPTSSSFVVLKDPDNPNDAKNYEKPRKQRWWDLRNVSSLVTSLVSSAAPNFFAAHRDPEEVYRQQLVSLFTEDKNNCSFYYSHTYDLTNTLQTNMTVPPVERMHRMKYVWNEFILEPFNSLFAKSADGPQNSPQEWFSAAFPDFSSPPAFLGSLASPRFTELVGERRWRIFVIRGAIIQHLLHTAADALPFSLTLITRVSKTFTGTRYLRRGINSDGHAANHVEVEQIVCEESRLGSHYLRGGYTSYVQVRGSVPLRWFHPLPMPTVLKPPIILGQLDGLYTETCRHFQHLLADYGAPIVVMDYLKQIEKEERESTLGTAYRVAVQVLAGSVDRAQQRSADPFTPASGTGEGVPFEGSHPSSKGFRQKKPLRGEEVLSYTAIDLRRTADRAWNVVTAAAEANEADIGLFVCHANGAIRQRQKGVVRSNCIDCVDRTNIGQLIYSLDALGRQLEALGLLRTAADLVLSSDVQEVLVSMFLFLGDAIATQYGGSPQVSAGVLHRGMGWDQFMGIKRLYNNMMSDEYKQGALNLFLGNFRPYSCPRNQDASVGLTSLGLRENGEGVNGIPLTLELPYSFMDPTIPSKVFDSTEASDYPIISLPHPVAGQFVQHPEDATESLAGNSMTTFRRLPITPRTAPSCHRKMPPSSANEPHEGMKGEAGPDYFQLADSAPPPPGSTLLKDWWIAPLAWWRHAYGREFGKAINNQGFRTVNLTSVENLNSKPELKPTLPAFRDSHSLPVLLNEEARRQRELGLPEVRFDPSFEEDYLTFSGNPISHNDGTKYPMDSMVTPFESTLFPVKRDPSLTRDHLSKDQHASQVRGGSISVSFFTEMKTANTFPIWQPRRQPILLYRSTRYVPKDSIFSLLDSEKAVVNTLRSSPRQAPFFCIPIWNLMHGCKDTRLSDFCPNELDSSQRDGTYFTDRFAFPNSLTASWTMKEHVHDHLRFPSQVHSSVYEAQQKKLEDETGISDDDEEFAKPFDEGAFAANPGVSSGLAFRANALLCLFGPPARWTNAEVKAALDYAASRRRARGISGLTGDGLDLIHAPVEGLLGPGATEGQRGLLRHLRAMARYLHRPPASPGAQASPKDAPSTPRGSSDPHGETAGRRGSALGGESPAALKACCAAMQFFFAEVLTPQTVEGVLRRFVGQLRAGVPRRDYIRYSTQSRKTVVNIPNRLTMPVIVCNAFSLRQAHRWLMENSEACRLRFHITNGDKRAAAFEAWRLLWWAACNSLIIAITIDNSSFQSASLSPSFRLQRSRDYLFKIFSDPTALFRFPGMVESVKLNWSSVEDGSLQWVRPFGRGVPRGISDQIPPTVLIEKLCSLALNAISEFQKAIVTGSLSLTDSVKMAKVLLESIEVGATALRNVDLLLIPAAERLCFFINLYNTLYAHAWMRITARGYSAGSILVPLNGEVMMALPTHLIEDFYRSHGYIIGSHWVSCYTIKYALLTSRPLPPSASSRESSLDSLPDELFAESFEQNGENGIDVGDAGGQNGAYLVDIDHQGFSQVLIDVGMRCTAHIVEPLVDVRDVALSSELSHLIQESWESIRHDVNHYLPRRMLLALLDTYLPPPSLVPDEMPMWAAGACCPFECGLGLSSDALACTETDRYAGLRSLFEMKASSSSPFDFSANTHEGGGIGGDNLPSPNAWTMLGNATMQLTAAVGATNDPYWALSLFQHRPQTPISRQIFSKCPTDDGSSPLESSSTSMPRSFTHLSIPLVCSASTMYGYNELLGIERDFIYSVQQSLKMRPLMLNAILAPILIQYPDIFGNSSDIVLQRLQQSQQSAMRAEKCRQACIQRLVGM